MNAIIYVTVACELVAFIEDMNTNGQDLLGATFTNI